MRSKLLVTAISVLTIVALALVIRMGDDPDASPPSLTKSRSPENRESGSPPKPDREARLGLVERLASDPHAALNWLLQTSGRDQSSSLSTDPRLQSAVIGAANRLMERTQSPWGNDKPVILENFVQQWAAVDLLSAYEWVYQVPAGDVRDSLMVRVAFAGSQINPAEAAWLVVDELPPGRIQEDAVVMVLHQWALQDPAAATAWVNLFPDNPLRDRALLELQGVTSYSQAGLAAP